MVVDWSEIHPSVDVVAGELRRLRFEQALATIKERQLFIADLTDAMRSDRKFRDTRPRKRRKRRVADSSQRSLADFTQRQLELGERILRDLANKTGGDTQ